MKWEYDTYVPSITWQSTLISFDHEIHCRDTRLTQLQLGVVHDSCDFPVVVVVGVYFWAMITHLISRNSFSRAPLPLSVCVCVCAREIGSALTGRVSVSAALCRRHGSFLLSSNCNWRRTLRPHLLHRFLPDRLADDSPPGLTPSPGPSSSSATSTSIRIPIPGPGRAWLGPFSVQTFVHTSSPACPVSCFALFCCFLRRARSRQSAQRTRCWAPSRVAFAIAFAFARSLRPLRLIYRLKTVCLLGRHLNLFSAFSMCYRAIVLSINLTCATEMQIKLEFLLIRHRFELIWFA